MCDSATIVFVFGYLFYLCLEINYISASKVGQYMSPSYTSIGGKC